MMDDKGVSGSNIFLSEERNDTLYPLCFGASFAFFALRLLSKPVMDDEKFSEIRDKMLQGSAQLLGLLMWRIQKEGTSGERCELLHKLKSARKEVEELKQRRREDAKANEKVVGIFAMQEQNWFGERKKLRQHVGALINELRVLETKKDESISELSERLQEKEDLIHSKDRELEEEVQNRRELEEKLKEAKRIAEELRETTKREAQERSSELWKHKTAYIELVSNQRQLEAEMSRLVRQAEAARQELDVVSEQKKESVVMVQKLSVEIMKMQKDLEQKDKILSAMLRKSKLDMAEKQMLLQEVKLSKAKRKQAELETEKWRAASESRHSRHSLRSMLSYHSNSRLQVSAVARGIHSMEAGSSQTGRTKSQTSSALLDYVQPVRKMEPVDFSPLSGQYSPEGNGELVITADVNRLEGWVRFEAEKYAAVVEQRHSTEIEAFVEQIRLKDEKLEASRWRLMSLELESKRLQSHIEGLNRDLSQVRQDNMKLEAMLFDREEELTAVKERTAVPLKPLNWPRVSLNSSQHELALGNDAVWSKLKIVKKKPKERESEPKTSSEEIHEEVECEKVEGASQSKDMILTHQSPEKEIQDEKDIATEPVLVKEETAPEDVEIVRKIAPADQFSSRRNNSLLKMDLHALGVTYKIKRLNQQLLLIERLRGKHESKQDKEIERGSHLEIKGFPVLISVLNRHLSRYQSLQEKIDDLCRRMHDNSLDMSSGDSTVRRTREETKTLEHFLEETFQLQRYIVATGQKLTEIQSKVATGFVEVTEDLVDSTSFDIKQFSDSIRTLLGEVQRGLEVRIARIIGDLEGTLACEGMTQFRR